MNVEGLTRYRRERRLKKMSSKGVVLVLGKGGVNTDPVMSRK